MESHKYVRPQEATSIGAPAYDPPQVEVVVTAEQLEREQQYGGFAAYGPI